MKKKWSQFTKDLSELPVWGIILIAAFAAALSVAEFIMAGPPAALIATLINITLSVMIITDASEGKIYNSSNIVFAVLAVISAFMIRMPILERLISFGLVLVFFILVNTVSHVPLSQMGGGGDLKLLMVAGFLLGQEITYAAGLGCLAAVIKILIDKLFKGKTLDPKEKIRMAPFFCPAIALVFFHVLIR